MEKEKDRDDKSANVDDSIKKENGSSILNKVIGSPSVEAGHVRSATKARVRIPTARAPSRQATSTPAGNSTKAAATGAG